MPASYRLTLLESHFPEILPTNVTCQLKTPANSNATTPLDVQLNNTLCDTNLYNIETIRCDAAHVPSLDDTRRMDASQRGRPLLVCQPDTALAALNAAIGDDECNENCLRMCCILSVLT